MIINKKAQNVSEYAIIVGLVGVSLLLMSTYFQRGIRVVVKEPIDHLGGFDSGIFTAPRIQELGIEHNVDPDYPVATPYQADSSFDSDTRIQTFTGGGRTLNIRRDRNEVDSNSEQFREIRYYRK